MGSVVTLALSRMPVIPHPRDYYRWISREVTDQPPIDLLNPFEFDEMEMHPANPLVGNVRNNGAETFALCRAGWVHGHGVGDAIPQAIPQPIDAGQDGRDVRLADHSTRFRAVQCGPTDSATSVSGPYQYGEHDVVSSDASGVNGNLLQLSIRIRKRVDHTGSQPHSCSGCAEPTRFRPGRFIGDGFRLFLLHLDASPTAI